MSGGHIRSTPDELILIPGHAAFQDSVDATPEDPALDRYWALQPFQSGEPPYYIEHIRAGVDRATENPHACLMFSGGRTRAEAGHWSEAATYAALAERYASDAVLAHTITELYARDSLENVQFSLARFYQLFGTYPMRLTVVGWQFKQERFTFHCRTLGWPLEKYAYIGCNNPENLAVAEAGEARTLALFRDDPWAEHDPLQSKRQARNPFHQTPPYREDMVAF